MGIFSLKNETDYDKSIVKLLGKTFSQVSFPSFVNNGDISIWYHDHSLSSLENISLMYIKNSTGPRIIPWGTPKLILDGLLNTLIISTQWVLFLR